MAKFAIPIEMHHPAHDPGRPAKIATMNDGSGFSPGVVIQNGTPCRYQPMSAASDEEEESLRAKGYMRKGEARKPVEGYHAFPKMLVHPDHVPAVPDEIFAERQDGGGMKTHVIKGKPEKMGPVTVNDAIEEAAWADKGYAEPVRSDPDAFQRSRAMPYDPSRVMTDYPKMVNGVLINDPALDSSGMQQYPKWVMSKGEKVLVETAAQEAALMDGTSEFPDSRVEALLMERRAASERDDDANVARVEAVLSAQGIEVKDKPHGTVWRRIEAVVEPHDDMNDGGEVSQQNGADTRATLIAGAEAKGIKVDKRWSLAKLQEALSAAA